MTEKEKKVYCCPKSGHTDPDLRDTRGDCGEVYYIRQSTIGGMCPECADARGTNP